MATTMTSTTALYDHQSLPGSRSRQSRSYTTGGMNDFTGSSNRHYDDSFNYEMEDVDRNSGADLYADQEEHIMDEKLKHHTSGDFGLEDTLENLVNMPISKELQSKRKRSKSRESLRKRAREPTSDSEQFPAGGHLRRPSQSSSTHSSSPYDMRKPSMIPIPKSSSAQSLYSRARSASPSRLGSSGGYPDRDSTTDVVLTMADARNRSQAAKKKGKAPMSFPANENSDESPSSKAVNKRTAGAGTHGKQGQANVSPNTVKKHAATTSPSAPAGGASRQRQRAVTGNLPSSRPPNVSPSRPAGASTKAPAKKAPPRSSKTGVSGRQRRFSTSSLNDNDPLPPWAAGAAPIMYRKDVSRPDLLNPDESADSSVPDTSKPSWDDVVLPAVARKLQKEWQEEQARRGDRDNELIGVWDREGRPAGAEMIVINGRLVRKESKEAKEAAKALGLKEGQDFPNPMPPIPLNPIKPPETQQVHSPPETNEPTSYPSQPPQEQSRPLSGTPQEISIPIGAAGETPVEEQDDKHSGRCCRCTIM